MDTGGEYVIVCGQAVVALLTSVAVIKFVDCVLNAFTGAIQSLHMHYRRWDRF